MVTNQIYLADLVTQMLKVNYEITVLEFRVGEAMPAAFKACYPHIKTLRDGYKDVESKVRAVIEGLEGDTEVTCAEIERSLAELLRLLDLEGGAIRGCLSEQIHFNNRALMREFRHGSLKAV